MNALCNIQILGGRLYSVEVTVLAGGDLIFGLNKERLFYNGQTCGFCQNVFYI